MKIQLVPGTTYVGKDGITYEPGSVVDVDEEQAESFIRTGSAVRADGPRPEGEVPMRRKTDR